MIDLSGYTTRHLLKLKNNCYHSEYEHKAGEPTHAEIMAELNTREHVPNKQEAKKIRQEHAKSGRRKNHH